MNIKIAPFSLCTKHLPLCYLIIVILLKKWFGKKLCSVSLNYDTVSEMKLYWLLILVPNQQNKNQELKVIAKKLKQ